MSMYDRVKNRRKSMEIDVYSEDHDEQADREPKEESNDQNNENDNETKTSKNKMKDAKLQNGDEGVSTGTDGMNVDQSNEENTMDVLNERADEQEEEVGQDDDEDDDDEEEEEEEEMNTRQAGKYSLRERKPPIQRFSLHGKSN